MGVPLACPSFWRTKQSPLCWKRTIRKLGDNDETSVNL